MALAMKVISQVEAQRKILEEAVSTALELASGKSDGAEVAVPQCRPAAKPSTIPASAPAAAAMAGIFHFSGVISPPAVSSKSIYTFGVPFSTGAEKNFREQDEGQVRCPRRRG